VKPPLKLLRLLAAGLAAVALTAPGPANGQVLYGSLVGTVVDSSGATVPGATITATNKETGLVLETTSNETGNYSIPNVQQGTYDVKAALTGFKEFVRPNVPVTIGTVSRVDVTLNVGDLTESVTVASESSLLQTDRADVHTELRSDEITALPTNQFRNYQALVNLVPGATPARFQNAETDTPARSLTTNVNGQNRNANATRTDGATNVNIWLPHHTMYVSPAETIDTVNISTNNFDAEQGMAGGAAITVVTKSGTNFFKGSAFEFFNNESLNARPYFFGNDPAGKPPKLPVDRNIFGGTIGGPIARNRLFFFGSYEGYKQSQNLDNFLSVPDDRIRNGDFSGALNADGSVQIIYDPLTGNPDGTGRQPFANNRIPADRIHRISRQLLDLYPSPNTPGFGPGGFTNNYRRDELRTTTRHNYDTKINWNRTSSHQIWGKFGLLDAVVDDRTYFLGPPADVEGDGGLTKVYQFTLGQTWTLSPTVILDSSFGFSRQDQSVLGSDFASGNFGLDVLGIPGTNDQGIGDDRYAGYPRFNTSVTGGVTTAGTPPLTAASPFTTLGNFEGWMPIFRDERTYSFATNLTKVMGAHEFRGGYLLNFLYLDHWQPELDNPRGCFDFTRANACTPGGGVTSGVTALRGGPQTPNFYNFFAQFLLGLPSTVSKSVQYEEMTGREWQHGLYFRDRWTVSGKLTLDLGLRWEYYPIMHRADRGIERVDLQTLEVLLGGRGGNPENVGLEASKNNFAPRLGAIYRVDDNTVVRAGYGVTYNPIPWSRPIRGFYPATIAAQFSGQADINSFQPYGTLDQGIPTITGPDLESGRFPLPGSVDMRTPEPGNVDRGTIQSWNLAFERRLPMNVSLDLAYVGTKGDGGYADLDINAPVEIGSGNSGRPFASLGRTRDLKSWGQRLKTRYHALQVALNRPFTGGLMLKGAYTWSKSMNMADDDGWVGLEFNTPSQLHRNYALAGFDRTHNFQLGFLYQLPWKADNGYGNVGKAIISDWQVNGVFAAYSGVPFNMSAGSGGVNTPSNRQTPDQVGELTHVGAVGASGLYYDPSAFVQPQGVKFGSVGRNAIRGPGGVNLDLALFRAFPLGATRKIEFRAEAINFTNTPKFGNPNGDVTNPNFMRITSTFPDGMTERQIRLGVRFAF
jgi:Carboxypeptidase regulatory-like domain/TonB dependent receptor-like, beta-barrel